MSHEDTVNKLVEDYFGWGVLAGQGLRNAIREALETVERKTWIEAKELWEAMTGDYDHDFRHACHEKSEEAIQETQGSPAAGPYTPITPPEGEISRSTRECLDDEALVKRLPESSSKDHSSACLLARTKYYPGEKPQCTQSCPARTSSTQTATKEAAIEAADKYLRNSKLTAEQNLAAESDFCAGFKAGAAYVARPDNEQAYGHTGPCPKGCSCVSASDVTEQWKPRMDPSSTMCCVSCGAPEGEWVVTPSAVAPREDKA